MPTIRPGLLGSLPLALLLPLTASLATGATQIVLLGTGTPNADPDRSGPATAIVVNGSAYLVDFGPGVVRRAAEAARRGITALEVKNLKVAFVTHLHSDHTAGYPDLIFTPAVLDRNAPLEVYGPKGLSAMTKHILKAYGEDMRIRLHGGEPSHPEGYVVHAHEIRPGTVYQDSNIAVKAFAVRHGAWSLAFGYRFETADRTIVISGDTTATPAIAENCRGCDVLIHEVYSDAGLSKRTPDWQSYHSRYHTSARALAAIANQAKPGLLILYHQLTWSASREDLLRELQATYTGKVAYGNDLDVY